MDVPLADAVSAMRDELLAAAARNSTNAIFFEVGPIDLEFEVALRAETKVGGGFKFWWVVDARAEVAGSGAKTHRVKLTLIPKDASGTPLLVGGSASSIHGPGNLEGHVAD